MAPAPKPGTSPTPAPPVAVMARCACSRASSRSSKPVRAATAPARCIAAPCKDCNGTGRIKQHKTLSVKIPAGVDEDDRIRLSGEGEHGVNGGPPGDLYVVIHLKAARGVPARPQRPALRNADQFHHRRARRRDRDPDAGRRGQRSRFPPKPRAGKSSACAARASRACAVHAHGDLHCHVVVETPVNLTDRQKELLREFEDINRERQRTPQPARQVLDEQGEGFLRRLISAPQVHAEVSPVPPAVFRLLESANSQRGNLQCIS